MYLHIADREHYFLSCMCGWMRTKCVFVASLLLPWKYMKSKPHSNVRVCVEKHLVGNPCKTTLYKKGGWKRKKFQFCHQLQHWILFTPWKCVLVCTGTLYQCSAWCCGLHRDLGTLGSRGVCVLRGRVINKQRSLTRWVPVWCLWVSVLTLRFISFTVALRRRVVTNPL